MNVSFGIPPKDVMILVIITWGTTQLIPKTRHFYKSWICWNGCLFTFHYGKSPLDYHFGEYFLFTFSAICLTNPSTSLSYFVIQIDLYHLTKLLHQVRLYPRHPKSSRHWMSKVLCSQENSDQKGEIEASKRFCVICGCFKDFLILNLENLKLYKWSNLTIICFF